MDRFTRCLEVVLKHEGGFVNHPKDPGGITNLGVTKKTWEAWTKAKVTEEDMRRLLPEHVHPLYQERFWQAVRADELPPGLDLSVFDFGVNAGPKRAIRTLQECLGVTSDGVLGRQTLAAVSRADVPMVIKEYALRRISFYRALPTFSTFGRGWSRRTKEIEAASLEAAHAN